MSNRIHRMLRNLGESKASLPGVVKSTKVE